MKKLWGGRFSVEADAVFRVFNDSYAFDKRLFYADIRGSLAYIEGLLRAGILTEDERYALKSGLEEILARGLQDPDYLEQGIKAGVEDVHAFIEGKLIDMLGDVGRKLHTGRSRNDQVATDIRLYLRDAIDYIDEQLVGLQRTLITQAETYIDVAFPGYTHMQKAQPVLFSHFLLAYFEMFLRDRRRFQLVREATNISPLGSAALAGSSYALDRHYLADLLNFEGITQNSMDAVSDRDFVLDFLHAATCLMMHMSRLSEDLIIYSSTEFGFIEMSERVATGSSIMPQKKNPDALELIRGKMGRVLGHYTAMQMVLKGLPMAYNKDLQEDKEGLFDAIDTIEGSLAVMQIVVESMQVKKERMMGAAKRDYLNATELADYLARKGLPFREGHEIVGEIVRYAIGKGKQLDELSLAEYKRHHSLFSEDIFEALALENTLARKDVHGGTATARVKAALQRAKVLLDEVAGSRGRPSALRYDL